MFENKTVKITSRSAVTKLKSKSEASQQMVTPVLDVVLLLM
jgi:hypothetical protein